MCMLRLGYIFVLFSTVCLCRYADARVWTDRNGNTLDAEFVQMSGDRVVLEKEDGDRITVPKDGLSEKDLKYLAGVIPPELKITVDRDEKVKKLAEGAGYTQKEETYTFKVTIRKVNKDEAARSFKAVMYVIGESVGDLYKDSLNKVIGWKEHAFSFDKENTTRFEMSCTVRIDDWRDKKEGWEYDGYILLITDDRGRVIQVINSKSMYDGWAPRMEKYKSGKTF